MCNDVDITSIDVQIRLMDGSFISNTFKPLEDVKLEELE